MSRRKQAKPRSLKREGEWPDGEVPAFEMDEQNATNSDNLSTDNKMGTECADECKEEPINTEYSPPNTPFATATGDTSISSTSDALGTDAEGSSSPTPSSSCATPNSATELADSELTFTLGATEATPYACQFCDKAFPRLSYLKKHEQTHSDQMPFRCEFCSRLFKHKRSRDRHIKLHTGDKKYKCSHCEAAFSRSDHLKIHLRTHDNGKPFQCTVCNRGYNTAAALTSHMQSHKKQTQPSQETVSSDQTTTVSSHTSLRCLQCSEVFQKADDLQNHTQTSHLIEAPSPNKQLAETTTRPSEHLQQFNVRLTSLNTKLTCMYCTRDSFTTMEQLQLHVQAMHRSILNGDLQDSSLQQSSPQYPPRSPVYPSLLLRSSTPAPTTPAQSPAPYMCSLCTMRFASAQALHLHSLNVHRLTSPVPQAVCPYCSLPFQTNEMFVEHCTRVHGVTVSLSPGPEQVRPTDLSKKGCFVLSSDDKPSSKRLKSGHVDCQTPTTATNQYEHAGTLLCNQCNAALPDFESFRSHLKLHLEQGGGPIRSFIHGVNMDPRTLFGTDAFRNIGTLTCPHCGQTLKDIISLERHVCGHFLTPVTEYVCRSCSKTFCTPDDLQKHLLDMHAHHLYRCTLCREMFDSKVAIQVHFAVKHSSECQMLRCTVCPSTTRSVFRTERAGKMHVRSSHDTNLLLPPIPTSASGKSTRCHFCMEEFDTELEMQFHITTHFQPYKCLICSKQFQVEYLLEKHMQEHHNLNQNANVTTITENVSERNITSKSSADIPLNHTALQKTSPTISLTKASSKSNSENNNIKLETSKNSNTNCDICDRNDFANETELVAHRKLVHHVKGSSKNGPVSLHCAYCSENCKSRTELENHMKSHSQNSGVSGKHKCNICDELCPSAAVLAEHKLTHCKVISGNCCTHCKATLNSDDEFYAHLVQHSNNNNVNSNHSQNNIQVSLPGPCVICRQTLISDVEVRMHARFHLRHTPYSSEYQCVLCLKNFDKSEVIAANGTMYICRHCFSQHNPTSATTPIQKIEPEIKVKKEGDMGNEKFSCIKCQLSFGSEPEIRAHLSTHLSSEGNSHECRLCRSAFSSSVKLQIHLIEHTFVGFGSFTCYLCSAVFTAAQGLHVHMLEHGLAARPYDCPRCSSKFFFRAELDNHSYEHVEQDNLFGNGKTVNGDSEYCSGSDLKSSPDKNDAYQTRCKECFKEFSSISNLLTHLKMHSEQHDSKDMSENENVFKTEFVKEEGMSSQEDSEYIEVSSPVYRQEDIIKKITYGSESTVADNN